MTDKEFERLLDDIAGERANTSTQHPDPRFTERQDGATPNGGDYSVAYYYDKDGNPCTKENAVAVNIIEFLNNGQRVNETYGLLGK